MTQPCGHPLAARQIVYDTERRSLRTVCWACRVEQSVRAKKENR